MNATPEKREKSWLRCYSSLGCPEQTLGEAVALAADFEIPCLELRALEGRLDLPELLGALPGGWAAARETAARKGVSVRVLGSSFRLAEPGEQEWKELFRFAQLAEAMGAPYLRVFGGGTWGKPVEPGYFRIAAESLRRWEDERARSGWEVDLLVETHDTLSASEPCLRLLEAAAGPVNFIWDSHHTWRLGGEEPQGTWQALRPYVKHVHLKDSAAAAGGTNPFTYTLPGAGEMPVAKVMQLLAQDGYQGAVSLEWERMWHPDLAPLREVLEACRNSGWW